MKAKQIIVDTICVVLAIELFYEGVSKLLAFYHYRAFLHHMPYVKWFSWGFAVLIPFAELGLAAGLAFSKRPVTFLMMTVGATIAFVIWICCVYFAAHVISWPFDGMWLKMEWLNKIIIALVMCWMALIGAWVAANTEKPAESSLA